MKYGLNFMLVLGNAKMIAATVEGRSVFYAKTKPSPFGKKTNLNKMISCLNERI